MDFIFELLKILITVTGTAALTYFLATKNARKFDVNTKLLDNVLNRLRK